MLLLVVGKINKIFSTLLFASTLILMQVQIIYADEISKEFRNDILKLLKMTGTEDLGLQMGVAVSNQFIDAVSRENPKIPQRAVVVIKDEIKQIFAEEMPKLIIEIVPVYAKYFTHDEVKSLIEFYKTPLGAKTIKVMPVVMNECMQIGQRWGTSLEPELLPRLEARFKKEGIE